METTKPKKKRLTEKQQMALDLMTSGLGMSYKDIAAAVGVNPRTLWDWRHEPAYTHFQEELKRIEDDRWLAIIDAARASAARLVAADNPKMTEFVLKNAGYNPTQKVEADVEMKSQVVIVDDLSNGNTT